MPHGRAGKGWIVREDKTRQRLITDFLELEVIRGRRASSAHVRRGASAESRGAKVRSNVVRVYVSRTALMQALAELAFCRRISDELSKLILKTSSSSKVISFDVRSDDEVMSMLRAHGIRFKLVGGGSPLNLDDSDVKRLIRSIVKFERRSERA